MMHCANLFKKLVLVWLLALLSSSLACGQTHPEHVSLELPLIGPHEQIIQHTAYTLSYNEKHEQANWVAYELTREETQKAFERSNKFMVDPKVNTGSASDADYAASGYDRGHLAPAGDMSWSSVSMTESFYYSNMSPQVPAFNRGIWKSLETLVRSWADEYGAIYIVTGPLLKEGLPQIGVDGVSIPAYYYKVILDYQTNEHKAIGFILPNAASHASLESFAVTVDQVEKLTGIDFFAALPDAAENSLEKEICVSCWTWSASSPSHATHSSSAAHESEAVQCTGITKAGSRCKRMTHDPSGKCYQHLH